MTSGQRRISLRAAVSLEVILLGTVASLWLPGGEDLHAFYLPFARGCLECGFPPYHASWLLAPLALIPARLAWPLLTLLTLAGLAWLSHRLGSNPLVVLLAFPTMAQVWLGQVDVLIVAGLALALLSPNPYLRGAGLLLASIKPQTAGAAILVLLWYDRERGKTLLIPGLALAISLLAWGVDWPLRWLLADRHPHQHAWRLATLYPGGLLAFAGVALLKGKRQKLVGALLASAVGLPFYGVYAYVTFLAFLAPWWALPVSYLWLAAYPWLGNLSLQLAWVLPLALLGHLLWPPVRAASAAARERRKTHAGQQNLKNH